MSHLNDVRNTRLFTKIKQTNHLLVAFLFSCEFYAAMLTYGVFAFFSELKKHIFTYRMALKFLRVSWSFIIRENSIVRCFFKWETGR